jgi:hypothetical protein
MLQNRTDRSYMVKMPLEQQGHKPDAQVCGTQRPIGIISGCHGFVLDLDPGLIRYSLLDSALFQSTAIGLFIGYRQRQRDRD